jgi:hypothetical protein
MEGAAPDNGAINLDFPFAELPERFDLDFLDPPPWFESLPGEFHALPFVLTIRPQKVRFSEGQRAALRTWLARTGKVYLTKLETEALAAQTGLSPRQIRVFFTNVRTREGRGRRPRKEAQPNGP